MDYSPWFPMLFELQKLNSRKTELALKVAEKVALNLKSEMGAELSRHGRDGHGYYWDHEGYLSFRRQYDSELQALRVEYRQICEQIVELTERIEAEIMVVAR